MSIHVTQFAFRNKRSLPRVLFALASMLSSAYCFFGWMSAVGRISGWIGLPQYEPQIPRLETQARLWSALAIALPFIAALVLTLDKTASDKQPRGDAPTSITYRAEKACAHTPVSRAPRCFSFGNPWLCCCVIPTWPLAPQARSAFRLTGQRRRALEDPCLRHGEWYDTSPPNGRCRAPDGTA
jgi:hypothetical protein